ncbi:MAG: adenylosuccinate synthetase, partial [Candidatus Cloacimonas sp. SDB]
ITFEGRFFIDPRAGIVLSLHKKLDSISEADSEKIKIGTTKRGIGPCYSDLIARVGIRMSDLLQEDQLRTKIKNLFHYHKTELENFEEQVESLLQAGEYFKPFLTQVPYFLESNRNKNLLFEGAQGSLLDVIYGTYPFVTSSHTIAGGISAGSGYSPRNIEKIIGVYKSYYTRVGEGPFPTELLDETGDRIRKQGNEYGATTGRPRRCGWFDAVAARYTAIINGIDEVALTLLDVLTGITELKICTGYSYKNEIIEQFPDNISILEELKPVYLSLPGWKEDITGIVGFDELPENAKAYVAKIEEILNKKVSIISVGPDRSQTILRTT